MREEMSDLKKKKNPTTLFSVRSFQWIGMPKSDPCGTPKCTDVNLDISPFKYTKW